MITLHRVVLIGSLVGAALVANTLVSAQNPANPPDISGEWRLDAAERDLTSQAPLGDYTGIPFNDAGRMRSDTTPESIWGTPEYQCRPHSSPHQWRGLGGARILQEQDPISREVTVFHIQFMRSLDRPVFMDGRPHPPAFAPHSWTGFSTGEWVGNTLKITTTHLKDGYLRRGGPQTTDMYTMTEFLTRHDNTLSIVTVVDDPLYQDQPYIHSTTYTYDPSFRVSTEQCNGPAVAENGGSDRHFVPHFLPGTNEDSRTEWIRGNGIIAGAARAAVPPQDWVPLVSARGGVKSLYPEYRTAINGADVVDSRVAALSVPAMKSANPVAKRIADQSPRDGQVHVLPVQGSVYMLVADGVNLTASIGPDGVAIVNAGAATMSEKVLAALNQLVKSTVAPPAPNACIGATCPKTWGWSSPYMSSMISSTAPARPLRYVINTSASPEHVGGNATLVAAGEGLSANSFGGASGNVEGAPVIAHENVLNRMSAPAGQRAPVPQAAWPTAAFYDDFSKLPSYFNGDPVIVYYQPAANTDGDSIVYFRRSEVIAAGDIFSTVSYPMIDVEKGGSVDGVIKGLNNILDLAFAEYRSQGGTWVVPGRGRLSDTADVASYRNMVVIIRDRVQDLIDKGRTVAQVKAAKLSLDFDGRYGATTGPWTTDMFIEAVYKSLSDKK